MFHQILDPLQSIGLTTLVALIPVAVLLVFLTGSDTASNALFRTLQKTTAMQIGVSPTLMVAASSSRV